jgi:hypothetical protein
MRRTYEPHVTIHRRTVVEQQYGDASVRSARIQTGQRFTGREVITDEPSRGCQ